MNSNAPAGRDEPDIAPSSLRICKVKSFKKLVSLWGQKSSKALRENSFFRNPFSKYVATQSISAGSTPVAAPFKFYNDGDKVLSHDTFAKRVKECSSKDVYAKCKILHTWRKTIPGMNEVSQCVLLVFHVVCVLNNALTNYWFLLLHYLNTT